VDGHGGSVEKTGPWRHRQIYPFPIGTRGAGLEPGYRRQPVTTWWVMAQRVADARLETPILV
jgi:hypothetical protein